MNKEVVQDNKDENKVGDEVGDDGNEVGDDGNEVGDGEGKNTDGDDSDDVTLETGVIVRPQLYLYNEARNLLQTTIYRYMDNIQRYEKLERELVADETLMILTFYNLLCQRRGTILSSNDCTSIAEYIRPAMLALIRPTEYM